MEKAKRNFFVDRLKGYACFLVLFGHVLMGIRKAGIEMPAFCYGLEKIIYSFHVPLFLFLNGLVYVLTGEWKRKNTRLDFINYKLINLGIPYVIFSAVYIIINSMVGGTNTDSSIYDVFMIWKTPVAQYWYIYALFFLFAAWTVMSSTWKNWQIIVIMLFVEFFGSAFDMKLGSFEVVAASALAFGLGTVTPIEKMEKTHWGIKAVVIAIHIALGIIVVKLGLEENYYVKKVLLIAGISASIFAISLLSELDIFKKVLAYISKYSFQTYLLHTIFTAAVRIVLQRMGITNWVIHIVAATAAGLFCSVAVAVIAEKTKIFNLCFFPTKTWNELKTLKEQ